MTAFQRTTSPDPGVVDEIRSLATPPDTPEDLDALVERAAGARFVCIGEASHGTHEFYAWRAELSRRLIEEHGFTWIGVEADWPDCWRLNRWVRGQSDQDLNARGVLARFPVVAADDPSAMAELVHRAAESSR